MAVGFLLFLLGGLYLWGGGLPEWRQVAVLHELVPVKDCACEKVPAAPLAQPVKVADGAPRPQWALYAHMQPRDKVVRMVLPVVFVPAAVPPEPRRIRVVLPMVPVTVPVVASPVAPVAVLPVVAEALPLVPPVPVPTARPTLAECGGPQAPDDRECMLRAARAVWAFEGEVQRVTPADYAWVKARRNRLWDQLDVLRQDLTARQEADWLDCLEVLSARMKVAGGKLGRAERRLLAQGD